jgi:hypothetical protein
VGDVIYVDDAMAGSMLVGLTGRWTSSGILRDVRSENGRARPEECDFQAVLAGGMGGGPGGPMGAQTPPATFEKVFENDFGALYRNAVKVEHAREPLKPDVPLNLLAVMAVVGLLLIAIDFLPLRLRRTRLAAAGIGALVVVACLVPLGSTAFGELRHPPTAPRGGWEGGPGPGGPGPGGPGFDPASALVEAMLQEADIDQSGTLDRGEFGRLAGRWFESWDADRSGELTLAEVTEGLRSAVRPPYDSGGPLPPDAPFGLGPEVFLAQRIFGACDANGDGRLMSDELRAALDKWFGEWDEGLKGALDAEGIARGLVQVLGPPPMFGDVDGPGDRRGGR